MKVFKGHELATRRALARQLLPHLAEVPKKVSTTPCSGKACSNHCADCKAKSPAKTEQELPRSAGRTEEIPCCKKTCQNCEQRAQESGR